MEVTSAMSLAQRSQIFVVPVTKWWAWRSNFVPNALEYRTPQNKCHKCHKPKIALPWHHGMLVWTTLKVRGVQMGAVVVDIQQGPRPMPNNPPRPSLKPDKVRSCGHIHATSTTSGGKSLVLLLKARKCWGTDISARRFDSNVLALWRNDPRRNKFLHITTSICQERSENPNTHHVSVPVVSLADFLQSTHPVNISEPHRTIRPRHCEISQDSGPSGESARLSGQRSWSSCIWPWAVNRAQDQIGSVHQRWLWGFEFWDKPVSKLFDLHTVLLAKFWGPRNCQFLLRASKQLDASLPMWTDLLVAPSITFWWDVDMHPFHEGEACTFQNSKKEHNKTLPGARGKLLKPAKLNRSSCAITKSQSG